MVKNHKNKNSTKNIIIWNKTISSTKDERILQIIIGMIEARLWLFLRQYLKRPILGISLIHQFVHGVLLDLVMMMTTFGCLDLTNAVMRFLKGFLKNKVQCVQFNNFPKWYSAKRLVSTFRKFRQNW